MSQFIKLTFRPGVNRDQTNYTNTGGWNECDKIRFRSGYPEKLGGWVKSTNIPFVGVCRQMWNWITTYSDNLLAIGTNEKLYIEAGGNYYDITPLRSTTPVISSPSTDNCIFTTNGSTTITVTLSVVHGAETGDYVVISGVTGDVGGVPDAQINAEHKVTKTSSTSFTFTVTTSATSTVAGGGGTAIDIDFLLQSGNAVATEGYGWGVGAWGRDAWGLGTSGAPIFLPQRDWWFDNFDNDLVANVRNGAGYWWERGTNVDPGVPLGVRAITLKQYAFDWATADPGLPFTPAEYEDAVPAQIMQLMVSQQDRHLIAFGAVPFGSTSTADFDPLLIRWADQDTPQDWRPQQTNTAGDLRVSRGSRIVRALPTRQEILVWTDTHLYTLQFLGTTDVFALQEYADNVSIMSPRAMATAANVTYWMGQDKFYSYSGRVETLPCTLRNHVFTNFNVDQASQVVCGTNEQWNEVWWFYPTAQSDYNDAYVVYNHLERIWYYGSIDRTAWLDTALRPTPQAANTNLSTSVGYLYSHEVGTDDDGVAMDSYILSSDIELGEGDQFMLTRRVIPDVSFDTSTANAPEATMTLFPRSFPGGPVFGDAADSQRVISTSITQFTPQVFIRARARAMAFKISSDTLGVQWQLGTPRVDARPDGKR